LGKISIIQGATPDFENEEIDKIVQNALKSGFTLSLVYTLPDKKPAAFLFCPYHLVYIGGICYVLGAVPATVLGGNGPEPSAPYALLAACRIKRAELTDHAFTPPRTLLVQKAAPGGVEVLFSCQRTDTILVFSPSHSAAGETAPDEAGPPDEYFLLSQINIYTPETLR
jgi:hypothetical protein